MPTERTLTPDELLELRQRLDDIDDGIIDLIAVGYGAMTWVFIGIFVIPLLTIGAWKVWGRRPPRPSPQA